MIVHMTSETSDPSKPKPQEAVISGRYAMTPEERAEMLEDMEEARKTFPVYQARMDAACRFTRSSLTRLYNV